MDQLTTGRKAMTVVDDFAVWSSGDRASRHCDRRVGGTWYVSSNASLTVRRDTDNAQVPMDARSRYCMRL